MWHSGGGRLCQCVLVLEDHQGQKERGQAGVTFTFGGHCGGFSFSTSASASSSISGFTINLQSATTWGCALVLLGG